MEWMVRTGRVTNPALVRMFPLFCAVGGALLLTHSHQIGDTRARYLVEFTHLPMGMFGIMSGWARWLELRADGQIKRWAGWVWPVCLVMVGLLLLDYREE
jgi:putative copper resistance protein D